MPTSSTLPRPGFNEPSRCRPCSASVTGLRLTSNFCGKEQSKCIRYCTRARMPQDRGGFLGKRLPASDEPRVCYRTSFQPRMDHSQASAVDLRPRNSDQCRDCPLPYSIRSVPARTVLTRNGKTQPLTCTGRHSGCIRLELSGVKC